MRKALLDALRSEEIYSMRIISFRDKRLRRLWERDEAAGLPPALVPKLRMMLTVLAGIGSEKELTVFPHWNAHRLTGDLDGSWSLTLTRNWRLIFKAEDGQILNLDLVDYH